MAPRLKKLNGTSTKTKRRVTLDGPVPQDQRLDRSSNVPNHILQLERAQLSLLQRQVLATKVGEVYGNRHMQQYALAANAKRQQSGLALLTNRFVQRDLSDWLLGESAEDASRRWKRQATEDQKKARERAKDGTQYPVFLPPRMVKP